MPADAIDNQIMSAVLPYLQSIAPPQSLTFPIVVEGVPPDSIEDVQDRPRVYLTHVRTDPNNEVSTSTHGWRSTFAVWIAAKDLRTTNQVRADVLRQVYAAEDTMIALCKTPLFPREFTRFDDPNKAGVALAVQSFAIDYLTDHSAT